MERHSFQTAQKNSVPDPAILKSLIEFEKTIVKMHTKIEIKRKRGRKVPVLLTTQMKKDLAVLVKHNSKLEDVTNVSKTQLDCTIHHTK